MIGRSVQERPLSLVVAASPEALQRRAPRVLIICRQHGDEPVAMRAALRLVRRLQQRGGPEGEAIRSRVVTLIVPDANPDGAAAQTRENAAGVDLNRDWEARTQPETRALFAALKRWQPQLVVDAHEWARDDLYSCNTIEVPLAAPPHLPPDAARHLQAWAGGALSACVRQGVYVQRSFWHATSDPRLAHRYLLSAWALPSLLYETAPAGTASDEERLAAATTFLWELLAAVAATAPAPPAAASAHRRSAPLPDPGPWPVVVVLCVALLLPRVCSATTRAACSPLASDDQLSPWGRPDGAGSRSRPPSTTRRRPTRAAGASAPGTREERGAGFSIRSNRP